MMKGLMGKIGIILFLLTCVRLNAAVTDTVSTYSSSMHKLIKALVIKPDTYDQHKKFPVIYLLHGYGGNFADWIIHVPDLKNLADTYQILIVCPDGNISSWYFDSPVDSSYQYETYITGELVNWMDTHYTTISNRSGRAITGLSMGGHGALYLSFKHQDIFGAAGSMSGGVDLCPFPLNWDISQRLGAYKDFPQRWENSSVINLTGLLTKNSVSLIIDCGSEDFFYGVNLRLHQKLLDMHLPHEYICRPGGHTWEYWGNSIFYQVLFFNKFFQLNTK